MRKLPVLVFLFVGMPSFVFATEVERKILVEIEIGKISDFIRLQEMNIDIVSRQLTPKVQAIVSRRELERLGEQDFKIHILIENLIKRFKEEIDTDGNLGKYHTYSEMVEELHKAAAMYPHITQLVDIGDSWEKWKGIADRDIWAIKISDNPYIEEEEEPDVLIVGCHHARELISVEIPLAIIRVLTSRYSFDPRIKYLVNNREIWVVPMLNPDGHVYVEEVYPMWRKNRNTNGYTDPAYQGVDLNRNYSFQWGYDDIGSSPYPWSQIYRGLAPFSEPETQAIKQLVETHNFVVSLSYHSYGNLFLFPWGYIDEDTEDHAIFERLGQIYCHNNGYVYGNAKDGVIYNTNGDMNDWIYGEQEVKNKCFGITIEVGDCFQPPSSEVPKLIQENLVPALWMIFLARWLPPTPIPDIRVNGWVPYEVPVHQGPLFYLESYEVFSMPVSGLPAGTYTLYFGVDTVMDGDVTWDSLYYDNVVVNVTE